MRWAIYPTCHMTAVSVSDWLSNIGSNAISLNRDTQTSSIWEHRILLIYLSAKGELKMKSDPMLSVHSSSFPTRDAVSP